MLRSPVLSKQVAGFSRTLEAFVISILLTIGLIAAPLLVAAAIILRPWKSEPAPKTASPAVAKATEAPKARVFLCCTFDGITETASGFSQSTIGDGEARRILLEGVISGPEFLVQGDDSQRYFAQYARKTVLEKLRLTEEEVGQAIVPWTGEERPGVGTIILYMQIDRITGKVTPKIMEVTHESTKSRHPTAGVHRMEKKNDIWRKDREPVNEATIHSVAICAEDRVHVEGDDYMLVICHVETFPRGKGFMPAVRTSQGSTAHNGDAHIGTTTDTYDKAVAQGKELYAKKVERLELDMKEQEKLRQRFDEQERLKQQS